MKLTDFLQEQPRPGATPEDNTLDDNTGAGNSLGVPGLSVSLGPETINELLSPVVVSASTGDVDGDGIIAMTAPVGPSGNSDSSVYSRRIDLSASSRIEASSYARQNEVEALEHEIESLRERLNNFREENIAMRNEISELRREIGA